MEDTEILSLILTSALLSLPFLHGNIFKCIGLNIIGALTIILIAFPEWHNPDMAVSSVTLKSKTFPPSLTIPLLGHPGVRNTKCEVSGMHTRNMAPASSSDMNSETATPTTVHSISTAGWHPDVSSASTSNVYHWNDWVIFPHGTMHWPFHFHPSFDSFKCGLGPGAKVWDFFEEGATYCHPSETLYFKPSKKKACLGDFIATLQCESDRTVCRLPLESNVWINGVKASNASHFFVSPFDSQIIGGLDDGACTQLYESYYYGKSTIKITFPNGNTVTRDGDSMVPESIPGSHHVEHVLRCNASDENVPERESLTIGLLPMHVSFVYHPKSSQVDLYVAHRVTLSNDWRSVFIINITLFCLAHWLADTKKNEYSKWTVIPEIIGLLASSAGVYLQKVTNSVFHRCKDIQNGELAAEMVTWIVLLELAANVACLVLLRSKANNVPIEESLRGKINNIRKLSYECAL